MEICQAFFGISPPPVPDVPGLYTSEVGDEKYCCRHRSLRSLVCNNSGATYKQVGLGRIIEHGRLTRRSSGLGLVPSDSYPTITEG